VLARSSPLKDRIAHSIGVDPSSLRSGETIDNHDSDDQIGCHDTGQPDWNISLVPSEGVQNSLRSSGTKTLSASATAVRPEKMIKTERVPASLLVSLDT
jgi:hypothetical protein